MDTARARDLLTAELADLDERVRYAESSRAEAASDAGDEGGSGTHPADHGADVTSSMDSELLLDTVADQRRGVRGALARIEAGSYGRCLVCDREIDDERLEARPEVPTCREHADTPVVV
ncbi:TraR/DksA C4-type zinc finger protein [Pseudonocardia sp.]|jgi:RNA polymerase-binding transcription factor DksA|uniref:TraR/DksA family transcriptional regulator n=1 Tax=Pseudonocardia sp. TaxID=60912 RepID=UPI00260C37E0|nr:TraR/DksA C4-type zinc finger protein [Pseudonocardia sp.]MCW2716889.1 transcriptional regulator, TraR/DksA family [Pseudonocardia sp.]